MAGFYSSLAVALSLTAGAPPAPSQDTPAPPTRHFDDRAGFVEPAAAARLDARLRAFRQQTGHEVVVAVLPSLPQGAALEEFTVRTAQAWRVGRKGLDDGVVLFLFVAERRLRLEVGYGLEDAIPDAGAKRILDDVITPRLRAGDRAGGLEAGIEAILAAAQGRRRAAPLPQPALPQPYVVQVTSTEVDALLGIPLVLAVLALKARERTMRSGAAGYPLPWLAAALLSVAAAFAGMYYDARGPTCAAGFMSGAGLLLLSVSPVWVAQLAGRRFKTTPRWARLPIRLWTAAVGAAWVCWALAPTASLGGWSFASVGRLLLFVGLAAWGAWRAQRWWPRILALGFAAILVLVFAAPGARGAPAFGMPLLWLLVWTVLGLILDRIFAALGRRPETWWMPASRGSSGGSWSSSSDRSWSSDASGGSSGGSSYTGGGGRFGGGGASGSW